nr:RNA-binding KH domain-containing protein RCF3-like [Tanacetum cinerariifolium]
MSNKRPRDHGASEANGKGKWQKSAFFTSVDTSFKIAPGSTVFRLLCPTSKAGSLIGKGGDKISQIRQESGAKVRVEETIPGCNERVVVIAGSEEDNRLVNSQSKNVDEETKETQATEGADNTDKHDEGSEQKPSVEGEETQSEKVTPSIQKGLFLVFDRMFEGEPTKNGGGEDACVLRLLVPSSQVGCILGKAGSVIKQLASESGSQIWVLPKDKLPACATSFDELIQELELNFF